MAYYVLKTPQIKQRVLKEIESAPEFVGVEIDTAKRKRTTQQNRFLWGTAYKIIADYDGRTKEYIHAKYASEGLGFEIITISGEKFLQPFSTKNLTTVEFSDYMNFIKEKAYVDHGLCIPDPNEYGLE